MCAVTGLNRDYARRALKEALKPRVVRPRPPRAPKYDAKVVAALEKCWAVENAPRCPTPTPPTRPCHDFAVYSS